MDFEVLVQTLQLQTLTTAQAKDFNAGINESVGDFLDAPCHKTLPGDLQRLAVLTTHLCTSCSCVKGLKHLTAPSVPLLEA